MSIRIAILEDEKILSIKLASVIRQWAGERELQVHISEYPCAKQLLADHKDGEVFDILFLDILLPSAPDGMQTARQIRITDKESIIIFLTASAEYIGEGYDVQALKYLMKPLRVPRIREYLDTAYTLIQSRKPSYYHYVSKKEIVKLPYKDILYIAASAQHIEMHTSSEKYKVWKRLKDLESELPSEFVRCHRSFIVNIETAQAIRDNTLQLNNGELIPIGELYAKQFKAIWMKRFG